MEGGRERDEGASLPPDYVSLAQLQERWMQKQREKKMREKEEEEKKKDGRGQMGGVVGRRQRKNGGESGVVEERGKEKEKEKETVIGGFGNGGKNRKRDGRKKNWRSRDMKSVRDEGKGEEIEKGKVGIEKGVENEVQSVAESGLKEVKDVASVAVVEVLPRNRVNGEIAGVRRGGFRGVLGENGDNRGWFYWDKKEYGGGYNELNQNEGTLASEKKVEDRKGNGQQWRGRGRGRGRGRWRGHNGEYGKRFDKMKESTPDVLKGNEVGLESKKGDEEVLEEFSEKCDLSGKDSSGVEGQSKNVISKIKKDVVEGVESSDDKKKVDHEVLVLESGKNGERGSVRTRYPGYRKWRGDNSKRFVGFSRFEDSLKMKQRESGKVWVKKEEKLGSNAGILVGQE